VCEFITGGGLYRDSLPASLLKEGELMRDAVLRDFAQLADVELSTTVDIRAQQPNHAHKIKEIRVEDDVWDIWHACMQDADAVLIIAPEMGGMLTRLTRMAESLGKMVLGCASSAVEIATDKWLTYLHLQQNQIPTLMTYQYADWTKLNHTINQWIAKPRDGVGCGDLQYFENIHDLDTSMQSRKETHLIQPFQKGIAASFSMLCRGGQAFLISCNRQKIHITPSAVTYNGGVVNELIQHQAAFEILAQKIVDAFPGLGGYVGVDLIVDQLDGQYRYYIVEINPRLTTSYVALHQACGVNPARMLLDLFYNEVFMMPVITHHKVEVSLNDPIN
jgi:predicted ATP-grasp superfamily ATP-dependent carboligase